VPARGEAGRLPASDAALAGEQLADFLCIALQFAARGPIDAVGASDDVFGALGAADSLRQLLARCI